MVAAVQRNAGIYNSNVLDTGDSEVSETADQIRSYHSVVMVQDDSTYGDDLSAPFPLGLRSFRLNEWQ